MTAALVAAAVIAAAAIAAPNQQPPGLSCYLAVVATVGGQAVATDPIYEIPCPKAQAKRKKVKKVGRLGA